MYEPQQHEMQLETTHPSGAEEWLCPTCGRRFLMHWPPDYKRVILEPGDEYAVHSGGKGGLRVGVSQFGSPTAGVAETQEDLPDNSWNKWGEWLRDVDFGE